MDDVFEGPERLVRSGTGQDGERIRERRGPFLVIGLGNPGVEYVFTPHNAGFLAIDRIAERCGATVNNRRCRALTATTKIAGRDVILAKPETYMNLSGIAVQALLHEFDADPQRDMIVLYDDLDLPLGRLQMKERGSAAGHNGARSVAGALRTDEWLRLRIGVGSEMSVLEGSRRGGKEYLLTQMRKPELAELDLVLDRVALAVETVLTAGVNAAMNEFNRRERNGPTE